jgi:Domain of unknown function (DUF397)
VKQLEWRTSSFCANDGCVQVAIDGDQILVRSSRDVETHLVFDANEWAAFIAGIRNHEFDIK